MNTAGRTEIEIKFLYLDALSIPSFTSQAMKRLILHIAGLLLMAACSTSPEQPAVTTIKVNADSFRTGGIDEFLDFSRCIVLQTPDSLPLGAVSTLQITEDRILVGDSRTQSAFIFDAQGRLLHVVSRQGRAANEYTVLTDCEFTADGTLLVYDGMTGKTLEYDPDDGRCLATRTLGPGVSFIGLSGELIAVNDANNWEEDHCAYRLYERGELIRTAVPFDEAMCGLRTTREYGNSLFSMYDGRICMSTTSDDTIYEIDPDTGGVTPFLTVDFGSRYRPQPLSAAVTDKIMDGEYPSFPYAFSDLGEAFLFCYNYNRYICVVLASRTGEVYYNGRLSPDKNGISLLPISCRNSGRAGELVSVVPAGRLSRALERRRKQAQDTAFVEELIERAGDNIVLMFYTFDPHPQDRQ